MSPIPLPINTPSTTYFSNLTYRNITQKNLKPTLHRTIALRLDVAVTEQSRRADRMIELVRVRFYQNTLLFCPAPQGFPQRIKAPVPLSIVA